MPKGVYGIRIGSHLHYKYKTVGHREMERFMIGVSPRITLMVTSVQSNFHVKEFPIDLNTYFNNYHNHRSRDVKYPYAFDGFHFYSKFRFLSFDHKNEHLRFAFYNELSYSSTKHLDAFPSLMGDASGFSFGLITTKLYKRFSASLMNGLTKHFPYKSSSGRDLIYFKAGNALNLNVSFGYLLFPKKYSAYRNLNVNLYLEVNNKVYGKPSVIRNSYYINSDRFNYLKSGYFSNIHPSVQLIFNSKLRVDIAIEKPMISSNDLDKYWMIILNVQRYFY